MPYVKPQYKEIARAKISKTTYIVISECSRGGYTMAKQLVVVDEENPSQTATVFLKGSFHVNSVDGLYELKRALEIAIDYDESGEGAGQSWEMEE